MTPPSSMPIAASAFRSKGALWMILKQPVVDQCQGAGLRGCDQLTDGVLAYVDGDEATGRAKLVAGAAQNNPEEVRKFAEMLTTLRDLPGMSEQMGPIGEVAAILAGDIPADIAPGGAALGAKSAARPADPGGSPGLATSPAVADKRLLAHTTSLDDDRRRTCRDHASESTTCVVHAGAVVVTDVVFDGPCEGAFAGALPRAVLATSSARWVLRKQVGGGTWPVDADEVFVVGGADGTRCDISWAARAR